MVKIIGPRIPILLKKMKALLKNGKIGNISHPNSNKGFVESKIRGIMLKSMLAAMMPLSNFALNL